MIPRKVRRPVEKRKAVKAEAGEESVTMRQVVGCWCAMMGEGMVGSSERREGRAIT